MTNDLIPVSEQSVPASEDEDLIIRPGQRPPFLVPWCASCKTTVDKFTFDFVTSTTQVGLQAECHGATQGIWVFNDDLFARKMLGRPIVLFKRRAFNGVR